MLRYWVLLERLRGQYCTYRCSQRLVEKPVKAGVFLWRRLCFLLLFEEKLQSPTALQHANASSASRRRVLRGQFVTCVTVTATFYFIITKGGGGDCCKGGGGRGRGVSYLRPRGDRDICCSCMCAGRFIYLAINITSNLTIDFLFACNQSFVKCAHSYCNACVGIIIFDS
jgi:hypothetical protein